MAGIVLLLLSVLSLNAGLSPAAADITGTWAFTVTLPRGEQERGTFVFKQDGEKLTGKYSGQLGEVALTGTVKGQAAEFTVPARNNRGEPLTLVYSGNIESVSKMSGSVDLGGKFTVEWSAVRK